MDESSMSDLELTKINPRAHRAGLRRLSQRANQRTLPSSSCSPSFSSTDSIAKLGLELADHLRAAGIPLASGLSDHEFERIEALLGFSFPPDLRALLAQGVPCGPGFPDWRSGSPATLYRWIGIPPAAASHQMDKFGQRCGGGTGGSPSGSSGDAGCRTPRCRLQTSPVMVPVFGFFFLPTSPARAGNPIFYVRNGSVVCCGGGIGEFVRRAFTGLDLNRGNGGCDIQEEFPFVIEEDDEGEEEGDRDRRRWSTSLVVENRPMLLLEDRSRSLPSYRIENREFESWGRNLDALATRSSLHEAMGKRRTKNTEKIPMEYPRNCTGRRASFAFYGASTSSSPQSWKSLWSGAHLDRIVTRTLVEISKIHRRHDPAASSSSSSSSRTIAARRIEVWSDVADRMIKQHSRQEGEEQEEFELSMCLSTVPVPSATSNSSTTHHRRTLSSSAALDRAPNSSSRPPIEGTKSETATLVAASSISPKSAVPAASIATNEKWDAEGPMSIPAVPEACSEANSLARQDGPRDGPSSSVDRDHRQASLFQPRTRGSLLLSSLLEDVAARLRSAGWREEDIVEMVEGSSPKSVLETVGKTGKEAEQRKRSSVLESMLLSNSLKAAGFSVQEVSDALCFDLGVECR